MAMIAALLILGLAAQGVMWVLSQQAQREREAELLRVGRLYAQAVASYYESSPGRVKQWPGRLEDLLEDPRFVGLRRHLRVLYADPVQRAADGGGWELVTAASGGIRGVRSRSQARPIRETGAELPLHAMADGVEQDRVAAPLRLAPARRYADWLFVYQPADVQFGGESGDAGGDARPDARADAGGVF
ncbi:MAG: hypothetical protein QM617_00625 [Comamonas sp.]